MILLNVNSRYQNNISMKAAAPVKGVEAQESTQNAASAAQTNATPAAPQNATAPAYNIRTQLTTNEEIGEYRAISSVLGKQEKKYLDLLLKTGRLLDANSNDKSSTLDNLYKIVSTQRANGLDAKNIINETIATLANPFIITQKFGDIPAPLTNKVLEEGLKGKALSENKTLDQVIKEQAALKQKYGDKSRNLSPLSEEHMPDILDQNSINVQHSGCCVAASIEFNFAKQNPAEFARFVEGLTSPSVSVNKKIDMKNLSDKSLDSIWLLNAFKIPYKMDNFDKASLVLSPDKNAIIRAQIQNSYKDNGERSIVDVLMQSTFMNVGSQQTYDSLTDVNHSELNTNDSGLGEFEKTFVESVVNNKNTTSVTFQKLDDDGKLTGYEFSTEKMMKYIMDSLSTGSSVIVGCADFDKDKKMINGHEITIIGLIKDKKGNYDFVVNDTDDDIPQAIFVPVQYLLPRIHHAGLPSEILKNEPQQPEAWREGLKSFQEEVKSQRKSNPTVTNPQTVVYPQAQVQTIPPAIVYNGIPYSYNPGISQHPSVQQAIYNQAVTR